MPREKYTKEMLESAVRSSTTMVEVLKNLGVTNYSGSLHNHLKAKIAALGIDASHLGSGRAWAKGRPSSKKKGWEEILRPTSTGKRGQTYQLRRAMLEAGVSHQCDVCKTGPEWQGRPLVLQLDHRDGDWSNHTKENLRFLCPNCHSQTETYGKRAKVRM